MRRAPAGYWNTFRASAEMRCAFVGVYDVVARELAKRAARRGGREVGIVERR